TRTDTVPVRVGDLVEMDVGEFEGLPGPQLRERFPNVMSTWDEDPASAVMPGGESLYDVRDRAWPAVETLAERHDSETVVAVTHNFTIHTIVCTALDMPLNNFRKLRIDLGAVTRLEISDARTTLVSLNETWHLK
ncbi:MAG: histidine phosphatase family protein, partial [Dehalococcoidia bacterium]|nr:histidine phosphatase family protein [Dehalococcoidia bacterium]